MIDLLTCEEYTNYLAYGEPVSEDTASRYQTEQHENDSHLEGLDWISTLESTTYPGMTFGYITAPCMYTAV